MSKVSFVEDYISQIDGALSRGSAGQPKPALVKEIVGVFASRIPDIKSSLDRYRQRIWSSGMPTPQIDDRRDLEVLRKKLELYREELIEAEGSRQAAPSTGQVSIYVENSANQTTNASPSAHATSSAAVTISQVSDAVDADPSLSEEQKAELQGLLAQAKGAAARGDSGLFARIGSKVMEGVEKATPGLVVKVIEFLLGLAAGGL